MELNSSVPLTLPMIKWGPLSRGCHKPGGQIPRKTHNRRHGNQSSLFICRVATVARPMDVRPTMRKPSLDHAKWCFQTSTRGLNSGTVLPVSGSVAETRSRLYRLHVGQLSQRFVRLVEPPNARLDVFQFQRHRQELLRNQAVAAPLPCVAFRLPSQ